MAELSKRLIEKADKEQSYLNRLIGAQYWIPDRPGMEQSIADLKAAAEALALVAWAEENEVDVSRWNGAWLAEVTRPMVEVEGETITFYYESDTLLGCIRAAKEAYEAQ